jgi:NADH-quinone oxidoreductase subunit N
MRLALSINGVAVVLLGVMPGSLLGACMSAMTKTLAS